MSTVATPRPPQAQVIPPQERFLAGDPVPLFHAATDANPRYAFDSVAGRYILLAFLGSSSNPASAAAWDALRAARAEGLFDDQRAAAFALTADPADAAPRLQDARPGLRVFRDQALAVSRLYGAVATPADADPRPIYTPFALLLDPMLRVLGAAPIAAIGALIAQLRSLPEPGLHGGAEVPAPVLVLPRVIEPDFCRRLIGLYETHGGSESGFMREVGGRTVGLLDPAHKRRKDHDIQDEEMRAGLRARLARRLIPEIEKAFQFKATRIERYIVACYDAADGGHFRAHRDNGTKGTAHRRFAVSINLNDDFDGGDLWFPEFGPRRYRPPPGGAVVFSCSLLHEATRVTRGARYATLPFLYDDEAALIRQQNRHFLGEAPG
jgi:predicted 2-oxoglutarate/Fe(II)-dependent dioxygenase YbiX